jgi:NTP pyrophosphatase (non-canonical NTP hydrolase)
MTDVGELNEELDLQLEPELRVLDLTSEAGELSKEVVTAQDYGETDFEVTEDLVDEFGDVYYCLLSLADELGIDSEAALEETLDKYRTRLDETGDIGSGE